MRISAVCRDTSMDVMHFKNDAFNISVDADADDEDKRLHQELKQLIAEQFENFDLGDDASDCPDVSNDEGISDANRFELNTEEIASINAAGKLSLLEGAIQKFGDEDTQASEDTLTDHLPIRSTRTLDCFQSTLPTHVAFSQIPHYGSPTQSNNSNSSDKRKTRDTERWTTAPGVQKHIEATKAPTLVKNGDSREPYFVDETINWELSLPGEVGNELFMSMQNDLTTPIPPVQAAGHNIQDPNANALVGEGYRQSKSPNIANQPVPSFSSEMPSGSPFGPGLQKPGTTMSPSVAFTQPLDIVPQWTANESSTSGERETLCAKLTASEQLVQTLRNDLQDHANQMSKLRLRLNECETSKDQLNNEILNLRSTNESLSAQLVELTTGDALRRVEAREGKLTEALERRYTVAADELREELTTAKKRLAEKEKEIAGLQRQVEVYKLDLNKAQENFADSLRRANQQLEESQQHCQKLSSSALCSEVTALRQKVATIEVSKKISDDVNTILQDELRDLREQVGIYERMLQLDEIPVDDLCPNEDRRDYRPGQYDVEGNDQLLETDTIHFSDTHLVQGRPSSRMGKCGEELHCSEKCTRPSSDNSRRRARFANSDPLLGPEQHATIPMEVGSEEFHSLTRQGILTSTPAPARSVMDRLKAELERCLANYKAKREQITKLHETLFTTRCQLHHATEAAQKAEKNATMLQDRVLSLERELASNRELGEAPGPREAALSGQLDRLKVDYAKLEEELQVLSHVF
ncbi:unnamed protein product [Echinostoma caproni]|uniref:Centrosomal protein of 162 kDa n=1 Tax=Echinostoma caproni TaxID=27848 RepID=A0A183AMW9_9TREM|nr:unnamed protein product [Echinostoma caproni]